MRTMIRLSSATAALLLLSPIATADHLQGRQNAQRKAASTAFPTVPSFTQASVTYGHFSKVYPSGYTLPSGATNTATASHSRGTGGRNAGKGRGTTSSQYDADVSQIYYIQSMCAPTITSSLSPTATSVLYIDLHYPCNIVKNATSICRIGESSGKGYNSLSAKGQQECLCDGGAGAAIWKNTVA